MGKCVYCGSETDELHKDHLIPQSRGGSDEIENCVTACAACNMNKTDKTPSEWRPVGLPFWVYEKERALSQKYRMTSRKARGRKASVSTYLRIPGYSLLRANTAICLDCSHGQRCGRSAGWEVRSTIDDTWGAYCFRCSRYWSENLRREMDEKRGVLHVLIQLRDGTLDLQQETTITALARKAELSIEEYLDIACHMLIGEQIIKDGLKESFTSLRLEMWEPVKCEVPKSTQTCQEEVW